MDRGETPAKRSTGIELRPRHCQPSEVMELWPDFVAEWAEQYRGRWRKRFDLLFTSPNVCCTVCQVDGGTAVSAMHFELGQASIPLPFRWSWISNVWTCPRWRGMGAARRMIADLLSRGTGMESAIWALSSERAGENPDANLYRDLGFAQLAPGSQIMVDGLPGPREDAGKRIKRQVLVRPLPSDMGAIAMILGRPHSEYVGDSWRVREGISEPEGVVCEWLYAGENLGVILYDNFDTSAGCLWLRPGSGPVLSIVNPEGLRSEPLLSAVDRARLHLQECQEEGSGQ